MSVVGNSKGKGNGMGRRRGVEFGLLDKILDMSLTVYKFKSLI